MKIQSVGIRSELIFSRFWGQVEDKGGYTVVKTEGNPDYYWGNFLIFDRAPVKDDSEAWMRLFREEMKHYADCGHYAFMWDTQETGDLSGFLDRGFEFQRGLFLSAERLRRPRFANEDVTIKALDTEDDWTRAYQLALKCADPKWKNEQFEPYLRTVHAGYRTMSATGRGHCFGAFMGQRLVAQLGIFFEGEIARYQRVETDPEFRRRGICGTLVYEAGKRMLGDYPIRELIMEADPEYHAARIYRSVGFQDREVLNAVLWWKRDR